MLSMFDDLGANLSVNAIRHANVLSGLIKGCYLNKVEAPLAEAEQPRSLKDGTGECMRTSSTRVRASANRDGQASAPQTNRT